MNHFKKLREGGIDFSIILVFAVIGLGSVLVFGKNKFPVETPANEDLILETPAPNNKKSVLQLNPLTFKRVPKPIPPTANACARNKFNEEADMFFASDPAPGGITNVGGKIRVWVRDGNGGSISEGEEVDPTTGKITKPGDVDAIDGLGPNYYRWEPALYLTKLTAPDQAGPYTGDAEEGGTPYFPSEVRGYVSYAGEDSNSGVKLPAVESPAGFEVPLDPTVERKHKSTDGLEVAQFTWDTNTLGLAPGSYYRAQFVVHDGDKDLAVNCMTIQT